MFESLDGWGGPVGFMVTSGAIAKVSVAGWLTAQGIMLLAVSLANLLPIPVLNGFQIILVVFEMLFRTKPSERIVVNLTYAGLLVCLVVFGRILFVDFIWVIRALW
jgi:regulator of sigma E protease